MTIHYPGPFGLRLFYSTVVSSVAIQHKAEYNIVLTDTNPTPGTIFNDLDVVRRDAASVPLETAVEAWAALLKPIFNSGAGNAIDYAELWKYEPMSYDASFISAYDIGEAGTSATAVVVAAQDVWVWRTALGGTMKFSFMETIFSPGIKDTVPLANAAAIAIYDFVMSGANWFQGRDGSQPFALIARYPGTNEALFKRRYR